MTDKQLKDIFPHVHPYYRRLAYGIYTMISNPDIANHPDWLKTDNK